MPDAVLIELGQIEMVGVLTLDGVDTLLLGDLFKLARFDIQLIDAVFFLAKPLK